MLIVGFYEILGDFVSSQKINVHVDFLGWVFARKNPPKAYGFCRKTAASMPQEMRNEKCVYFFCRIMPAKEGGAELRKHCGRAHCSG